MTATSLLTGKTHREVVRGTRGALHIAHPMADKTLCGVAIGERCAVDAFGRTSVDGYGGWPHPKAPVHGYEVDCRRCCGETFAGGNEERLLGCYA